MKYEMLFETDYLKNFEDFKRCEGLWNDIDENEVKEWFKRAYELSLQVDENPREYLIWENAIKHLEAGLVIRLPFHFIREKNDLKKCPLCACSYDGLGALSRRDNETEICGNCGTNEAFEDMGKYRG